MDIIRKLVKNYPNDQELGAKVREYVLKNSTCCSKEENQGVYTDYVGVVFPQCKECGKILM